MNEEKSQENKDNSNRMTTSLDESTQKPTPQDHQSALKSLRTYQGDIEDIIGKKNISITSIAIAENNRKEEVEENNISRPPSQVKNKFFFATGSILVIVGVLVIGLFYFFRVYSSTPSQASLNHTLITYTREVSLSEATSSPATLTDAIIQNKNSFNVGMNSVLYFSFGAPQTSPKNIINLLAPHAPSILTRSLDQDYMIGIYSYTLNAPFILLTTSDYGRTYSGMLQWEETMVGDLGSLFSIPALDINSTSTTPYIFHDESVHNKDIRIIQDQNGKTLLVYGFLDISTLLITQNEDIFTAILGRFVTSKMVR